MPATRNLELSALSAISQVIDTALDLEQTLREVLRILAETLSMKRATVTLIDRATGRLAISASHGLTREEQERGVYRLDEGVTGRIFRTAAPYYVPDIRKEPLFLDKTGSRGLEKGRVSFVGVPILLHGSPIGVLNVDRLFGDEVAYEEDIRFLGVVATLIAQFISLNEKIAAREAELRRENVSLKQRIAKEGKGPYIVGKSLAMLEVERQMEKVAPTRATVLLLGESGTGKTLIARIIHELSARNQHPFIKVNCAAIPETLLESELFGFEKGAFTGATGSKPGRFEEAHLGTIFLDEVGELPAGLQAKLLRVLQDREFERLGSNKTRQVDVRILAATNKDLGQMAEAGAFRQDLYFRLSVFPIQAPPLRARKEDIPGLLNHFLRKVAREYGRDLTLTPAALDLLVAHDWPGNVREMENLIERLVILADAERVDADSIAPHLHPAREPAPAAVPPGPQSAAHGPHASLRDMEKAEVLAALRRCGWVQCKAARDLGLSARQMGYRIKTFGLAGLVAVERARLRQGA
jgi:Nif-specific regulatory protein